MKNFFIYFLAIIISIIVVGLIFFMIDLYRIKENKNPIFMIENERLKDGGTTSYIGLGYKVIKYNQLNGRKDTIIGNWFLKYEEAKVNLMYRKLEELPQNYKFEDALNDKCFITTNDKIYNKEELIRFIKNTEINSKNRITDTLRIIQYTIEGDMIISEISYTQNGNYEITIDNTRDKFASTQDRKIVKNIYPGEFYGIMEEEKSEKVEVWLELYAEINYVEGVKPYEPVLLCKYPKNFNPSFIAKVIEESRTYIIVEPEENEEIRKSSDKISIFLGEDNDMIFKQGTKLKITHTGIIRETYPAQIDLVNIEIVE